jgi:AraC-like DNA-binding protein
MIALSYAHGSSFPSPTGPPVSIRLNNAAMNIAGGMTVNEAAMDVGYISASQISREFKRMYGQSPRHWSDALHLSTQDV